MNDPRNSADPASWDDADESRLQELLESAGPRPAVPAEDLNAIKEAFRAEWRQKYAHDPVSEQPMAAPARPHFGSRSRQDNEARHDDLPRKGDHRPAPLWASFALAASLVFAAVATWWWLRPAPAPGPVVAAHIENGSGEITAILDGTRIAVSGPESPVMAGTVLETSASEEVKRTRLAMRLTSGSALRLAPGSRLRLESDTLLHLERGALYVDSGTGPERGAPVEVHTPFGTATDIGTQFEVRVLEPDGQEGALRVRVREGRVEVTEDGETYGADAGSELTLSARGEVERTAIQSHGDLWAWVMEAAPTPEIEGTTVGDLLAWAAREAGWQVRFEPAELEEQAEAIVLRGSAGELSPTEIPLVLPSAGLHGEVTDGTLVVTRTP